MKKGKVQKKSSKMPGKAQYASMKKKIQEYEEEIAQLKKEFDILFMQSPINYVILTDNMHIYHCNHAFEMLFDLASNLSSPFTDYVEFDYQSEVSAFFEKVRIEGTTEEMFLKMTDGYHSYELKLICRPVQKNTHWFYHCTLIDITREMRALEEVAYLNYHDQLTGLYNRRFFEEELMRLNAKRNIPLALVMGDVFSLKKINESFGFESGNHVLYAIGKRLKEKVREDDIVARIGEDTFAILLIRTSVEEVETFIKRLNLCFDNVGADEVSAEVVWSYAIKWDCEDDLNVFVRDAENAVIETKEALKEKRQ